MRWIGAILAMAALPSGALADSGLEALTRRDQILGWEAVGRIDIEGDGFCTGTLIATDLVLTAAHCVYTSRGQPIDVAKMVFRAGLADGVAIAEVKIARSVADPEYAPTQPMDANQLRHDVALLQLEQPIPAAVAAPFTVTRPGDGDKVSVVSYAEDRKDSLSWQKVCSVLAKGRGLIAVNCDVSFGSSGAPVLDRSFGRGRIVSIISTGQIDENGRAEVLGMELPTVVDALKAMLRRGKTLSEIATVNTKPVIRRIGDGSGNPDIGARFVKP